MKHSHYLIFKNETQNLHFRKNPQYETFLEPCKNQEGYDSQCRNWKQNDPNMCHDEYMKDKCKGECNEECGK